MCGIWGYVSHNQSPLFTYDLRDLRDLAIITSLRGEHSTGMMTARKKLDGTLGTSWIRKVGNPFSLLNDESFSDWAKDNLDNPHCVVGHGRHATKGEVTNENAHPFDLGDIIFLHNGTIRNGVTLEKGKTDSEAVGKSFLKIGVQETLKKIQGAYVFIWIDKRDDTLNIIKNNERPLNFVERNGFTMFASEKAMLELILSRDTPSGNYQNYVLDKEPQAFKNLVWYKKDIGKATEVTQTEVEGYKFPVVVYKHTAHQSKTTIPSINPSVGKPLPNRKGMSMEFVKTYHTVQGKMVQFYIDDAVKDNKGELVTYTGEILESTNPDLVSVPIMFKSKQRSDFDGYINTTILEGKVIGIQMFDDKEHLIIRTKTIEEISKDLHVHPDDDELLTLVTGEQISKEEFDTYAAKDCEHCNDVLDIAEVGKMMTYKNALGKVSLECPRCVQELNYEGVVNANWFH